MPAVEPVPIETGQHGGLAANGNAVCATKTRACAMLRSWRGAKRGLLLSPTLSPPKADLLWSCSQPTMSLTGWTTGWSESAVTWSGQPNLATLANGAVVNSVASNFLLVCPWFQLLRSACKISDRPPCSSVLQGCAEGFLLLHASSGSAAGRRTCTPHQPCAPYQKCWPGQRDGL